MKMWGVRTLDPEGMGQRQLDPGKVISGEVVDGVTDDVVHVDGADLVDQHSGQSAGDFVLGTMDGRAGGGGRGTTVTTDNGDYDGDRTKPNRLPSALGCGGDPGRPDRPPRGSPGLWVRVAVLAFQRLSVCVELRQPAFMIQEPQRAAQRLRGAFAGLAGFAQDALVVRGRTGTD